MLSRDAMIASLVESISIAVSKKRSKIFSDRFFDENLENNPNPKIWDYI
jgi:hypothetical protein